MARPRPMTRPISRSFYDPHAADKYLPPTLTALFDAADPAMNAIAIRITEAKLSGANVLDDKVLEACIAAGRRDHAEAQLDGAA